MVEEALFKVAKEGRSLQLITVKMVKTSLQPSNSPLTFAFDKGLHYHLQHSNKTEHIKALDYLTMTK